MIIRAPRDIGALVRDRRKSLRMNQQDLADKVGVSRLWIINLEHGKATSQLDLVLRTLNYLSVILYVEFETKNRVAEDGVDIDAIIDSRAGKRPA
jgi:HTH-type transcriptional regulator / antitoxin HipB